MISSKFLTLKISLLTRVNGEVAILKVNFHSCRVNRSTLVMSIGCFTRSTDDVSSRKRDLTSTYTKQG